MDVMLNDEDFDILIDRLRQAVQLERYQMN